MNPAVPATQFTPGHDAATSRCAVEVANLSYFFGSGELRKQVLDNVNLRIGRGEIVIMTGPSGSGKTTLLTLIGTLRRVQEGELHVLGQPLHSVSRHQLVRIRRQMGFVFQAHNLFESLTALQNVRMALEVEKKYLSSTERNARCAAVLEQMGLGDRLHHRPRQLSGGQKQRVAIARGLVHGPQLVLADEPTAALDEQSGRAVVTLLQQLAKDAGVTIIMVTHDNRILDVADRIVNLVDGTIRSDVRVYEASRIGEMLSRCDLFIGLTPRTLTELADAMQVEEVPAGKRVIAQGDIGDRFYLIRDGRAVVTRDPGGQHLNDLGPGDYFGETALLTGQPRNANVDAATDMVLYSLDPESFHRAIEQRASMDQEVRSSLFGR